MSATGHLNYGFSSSNMNRQPGSANTLTCKHHKVPKVMFQLKISMSNEVRIDFLGGTVIIIINFITTSMVTLVHVCKTPGSERDNVRCSYHCLLAFLVSLEVLLTGIPVVVVLVHAFVGSIRLLDSKVYIVGNCKDRHNIIYNRKRSTYHNMHSTIVDVY